MIKTISKFKLCGEDIIPKFDHLIAPYRFTTVFNQTTFSFLISHNLQQFFHNSQQFFSQPQLITLRITNSLIMIISVLILHQTPWLIPFQAKLKEFQMDFNLKYLWKSQEIPIFGIPNSCS
jgi:hypothetical protein